MRLKYFIFSGFFLIFNTVLQVSFAQTGSWQPAGAVQSFPRTLLKASELPAVRQSFSDPERFNLYRSVYSSANNTPPASNATSSERRLRAKIAKNAAFIRIVNLKPVSGLTDTLNPTEKAQLNAKVISLLENINTAVETPYSYTEWQWRSKELIDYLIAYDLLRGAGVPVSSLAASQVKLQEFAGKLYTEANKNVFFVGVFLRDMKNNHLLMTASALGMAGVVLNDLSSTTVAYQPQTWINAGMYAIDNLLWRDTKRQSEPGVIAGYAEGPYYFKYSFLNCLPFFRAFGNFLPDATYSFTYNNTTRQIRNPYFDPNYDLLYQWITEITMPDGRLPALENSYIDMAMPELALTGKPQFVKTFYPQNLEPQQIKTLSSQLDGTVDMRAAYLAANVTPQTNIHKELTALPVSGNLIMRSGDGFTGNYMHVYGKNGNMLQNSGGHNHGDAGSFMLYAHGQLLALDAGYLKYDRRAEVGNATNHNLVLVDGNGPLIGTGAANDAEAFIKNTFSVPGLQYGEVHTAYSGATIVRKTLDIKGKYYLISDFISAAQPHTYTWQLHGFGLENGTTFQGTFTDNAANNEGIWQKNGVSMQAHVTATNTASAYKKTTAIHETTYDLAENHTAFLVQKDTVSQTQFLAALHPFTGPAATSVRTLNLPNMAGLVSVSAEFTDVAVTKADTLLRSIAVTELPEALQSDAQLSFVSIDVLGGMDQVFLQNGTTLFYGGEQIIKSSRRADLVWEKLQEGEYEGYVNKPVTLQVKLAQEPERVSGQNLSAWSYNEATGFLSAIFSAPSDFQFEVANAPLPVNLVSFEAKNTGNTVNLSWQTAQERNNRHFIVQRSADAKTWKNITTVNGKGTTNSVNNYRYSDQPDANGILYYRLLQEDFDGTVSYSAVRSVTLGKAAHKAISVYPNPAKETVYLELENPITENATLVFYAATGKEAYRTALKVISGENRIAVPLPQNLKPGLYSMKLQTKASTHTFRLVKQ